MFWESSIRNRKMKVGDAQEGPRAALGGRAACTVVAASERSAGLGGGKRRPSPGRPAPHLSAVGGGAGGCTWEGRGEAEDQPGLPPGSVYNHQAASPSGELTVSSVVLEE